MLKVGILGAGFMGSTHAQAFSLLPDVQIVGISSRSMEKAKALAAKYGAEAFTDPLKVVNDPSVEAISNTLPTYLHKDLTSAALLAGKHVLLEKPMALSVDECDELISAAQRTDRILMIGHTVRFWPECVSVVDFVKSGGLEKPLAAVATRLAGPPRWSDWFLHPEWSGGAVLDLHIHDLDTFNWLFGKPKTVYSQGQRSLETGGWEMAMTLIDYGDVKAFAQASAMQSPEYPFTTTLSILCEKGSVEFSFRAGGVQVDSREAGTQGAMVYEKGEAPRMLECPSGDAYANEVAVFVDSVKNGTPVRNGTPEQGRLAVATALAARRSIETGQIESL